MKQEKDFGQGHRIGAGRIWAPIPTLLRTHGYDFTFFCSSMEYRLIDRKKPHHTNQYICIDCTFSLLTAIFDIQPSLVSFISNSLSLKLIIICFYKY